MEEQVPCEGGQLREHRPHVLAALVELVQQEEGLLGVPAQNQFHQPGGLEVSRQPQHVQHRGGVNGPSSGSALVQKAQPVPQGSVRQAA